jgi:hypothetical protein
VVTSERSWPAVTAAATLVPVGASCCTVHPDDRINRAQKVANKTSSVRTACTALVDAWSPRKSLSAEEVGFPIRVNNLRDRYVAGLQVFGDQMTLLSKDPYLFTDTAWNSAMITSIDGVRTLTAEIRAIQAPARYRSAWATMNQAADELDAAMDDITVGLATLNVATVQSGIEPLQTGTDLMIQSSEAIDAAARY